MIEFIIPLGLLALSLVIGVPIAFGLAISGMVGLMLSGANFDQMMSLAFQTTYSQVSNWLILAIPMFILMAEFLSKSNLVEDIFEAAYRWTGQLKGGLAYATIVANGGMAALSGSSSATAATMSRLTIPEMQKRNYDDRLSLGTVSAAGTFASMIPPSIILIIYGVLTQTSITELFIAGIVPGILTLLSYFAVVAIWANTNDNLIGIEKESFSWREKFGALKPIGPALLVVFIVIFGLYGGVVTPTEAGALGATGTLIVGAWFGDLGLSGFREALLDTVETTAMIVLIMIGALLFGRYLAFSGAIPQLLDFFTSLPVGSLAILVAILIVYILLGTVIESIAILMITLPVTYPVAINLGYDPVWFGILITKTIEIGLITPPLGMNVYIASGVMDLDPVTGFRGSMRYIIPDLLILILMILVPQVVMYLPGTM
jgi:tripartite ATP-independent transporter DctM subunit